MSDLDPSRLLECYRQAQTPSVAEHEQALGAVMRRVDAGDPGLTLMAPANKFGLQSLVLVLTGGALVLAGVGIGFGLGDRGPDRAAVVTAPVVTAPVDAAPLDPAEPSPSSTPATPRPVTAIEQPASPVAAPIEPSKPEPEPAKPKPDHEPDQPATKLAPAPAQTASTLREEMRLLSKGRALLRDGDAAAALVLFASHESRFSAGVLAEEREVQRHEALCALGREADAKQLRADFARDYPGSPHAAKLAHGCQAGSP